MISHLDSNLKRLSDPGHVASAVSSQPVPVPEVTDGLTPIYLLVRENGNVLSYFVLFGHTIIIRHEINTSDVR